MKTTAAVLTDFHKPFELMELDVDRPGDEKTIRGSLFGSGNPQRDIVKMLDLVEGRNVRGVIVHDT